MNKILLVGCGHMGSALLKSWSLNTNNYFFIIDPIQYKKINKMNNKKIKAFKNITDLKNYNLINIVIFAIKPQIAKNVLIEISKKKFKKNTIYLSIVAGKKISFFNNFLPPNNQFIRSMPNMPALVNQGMTCLIPNSNTTKNSIKIIDLLFLKVGKTFWLKKESDINKITAISGSGPGYIFFFIDAFEKAAKQMGLGEKNTKKLVHQTLKGTIDLFFNEKKSAEILANNIAIKGGTTEAGLNNFKKNKVLHKTFKQVIKAAYNQANKLSR